MNGELRAVHDRAQVAGVLLRRRSIDILIRLVGPEWRYDRRLLLSPDDDDFTALINDELRLQ